MPQCKYRRMVPGTVIRLTGNNWTAGERAVLRTVTRNSPDTRGVWRAYFVMHEPGGLEWWTCQGGFDSEIARDNAQV